jgi:hypothetical protein
VQPDRRNKLFFGFAEDTGQERGGGATKDLHQTEPSRSTGGVQAGWPCGQRINMNARTLQGLAKPAARGDMSN